MPFLDYNQINQDSVIYQHFYTYFDKLSENPTSDIQE